MQIASAVHVIVHTERMRDGIRRVQKIAEVGWVGGDAISMRDLFTFEHRGERRDGTIEGVFESSRMRPDLAVRAAQFGLERQLLEALGVTAG
jgi:pilus assembly protein CpaF